jgi:hypothetical protein
MGSLPSDVDVLIDSPPAAVLYSRVLEWLLIDLSVLCTLSIAEHRQIQSFIFSPGFFMVAEDLISLT